MKPSAFEFVAPTTLADVVFELNRYGEDGRILAGGQSLVPLLNMRMARPTGLVSINHCKELSYIRVDDNTLVFGALTRQSEAEHSPLVRQFCPLLAETLPWVGCVASRNRGTVCGSLAHADPCAELAAVAVALDAQFHITSVVGSRQVGPEEFFVSELTTCIRPGEILEAVRFLQCEAGTRVAFEKVSSRAHGFALAAVAAQVVVNPDGVCTSARFAAIGAGATAVRLMETEQMLVGRRIVDADIEAASHAIYTVLEPFDDLHADADYRRRIIVAMVARAIKKLQ